VIEFATHQGEADSWRAETLERRAAGDGNDFFDAGVVALFAIF
jgi:hypothetical protein